MDRNSLKILKFIYKNRDNVDVPIVRKKFSKFNESDFYAILTGLEDLGFITHKNMVPESADIWSKLYRYPVADNSPLKITRKGIAFIDTSLSAKRKWALGIIGFIVTTFVAVAAIYFK